MLHTEGRNHVPPPPTSPGALLGELPEGDRNELLAFLDFFRALSPEERGLFVKAAKPDLTDEQVARLAGVTRRSVYRWKRYQVFKHRAVAYFAARHRPFDTPGLAAE